MSEKYEVKNGSFSLFKNKNRTEENKQPHYNGGGKDLNGSDFQVSAWVSISKGGLKYLSCKMQEPYEKKQEENNSTNDDLGLDF